MDSIWFSVDNSCDLEDDCTTSHLGVFNQDPSEIASWLPRPETPFNFPASAPTCSFRYQEQQQEYDIPASPPSILSSFNSGRELRVF